MILFKYDIASSPSNPAELIVSIKTRILSSKSTGLILVVNSAYLFLRSLKEWIPSFFLFSSYTLSKVSSNLLFTYSSLLRHTNPSKLEFNLAFAKSLSSNAFDESATIGNSFIVK